MGVKGIDIEF